MKYPPLVVIADSINENIRTAIDWTRLNIAKGIELLSNSKPRISESWVFTELSWKPQIKVTKKANHEYLYTAKKAINVTIYIRIRPIPTNVEK